jgi:hypothetical protein
MRRHMLMTSLSVVALLGTAIQGVAQEAEGPGAAQENDEARFRALVFSKVTNFYHDSIPAGQALIEQLGEENDFEVVIDDDASVFNDRASGQITTRVRCADPAAALATIRAQHGSGGHTTPG